MKGTLLFVLSLLSCMASFAQEIKGKITDSGTAKPVPGATIASGAKLTVGANNLLDIYPDKVTDKALNDDGRYVYSPTVYQFGFNGRFVFAKLSINL